MVMNLNEFLLILLTAVFASTIFTILSNYLKQKTKIPLPKNSKMKINIFNIEKAIQEIFSYYEKPKVFFSYSLKDKAFAERLARDLQERGIQTWLAGQQIKPGDKWQPKIGKALEESGYFFAIISKSSIDSDWVQKELEIGIENENKDKLFRVIPLLLENVEIPWNIKEKVYVDFRKDYQSGLEKILEIFEDRFYITKNKMRGLIINLTEDLYQYENIPNDVMELHKMHAIPDLFNEPFRENLSIKILFLKHLENHPNFFLSQRSWIFRVFNTARSDTKEKNFKKINGNGLVHSFYEPIYDENIFNRSNEKIKEYFKLLDVKFRCINGQNIKNYSPIFIPYEEFNIEKCIPLNSDYLVNKFYAIYQIHLDESWKRIEISFYFDKSISPGESLDIEFEYKTISTNFNNIIFDFPSYVKNFNFKLDLGNGFMTDIAASIIGAGHIVKKSEKDISYYGWILPHSSISCSWNKLIQR